MTAKEAYQYFVLRAQEIAISKDWTPVNWYALIYTKIIFILGIRLACFILPVKQTSQEIPFSLIRDSDL